MILIFIYIYIQLNHIIPIKPQSMIMGNLRGLDGARDVAGYHDVTSQN